MMQPTRMHWVRAVPSDFGGQAPAPRSGHTAVAIGGSKVVVFGGFADKLFLADIAVYDVENRLWYTPECSGSGPSPRAFHIAVVIDCNMFVFGGRSGGKRLGDFWMLDTDIWQWSEMTGFGDLPSPREFAAASAIGNRKIVMHGGWDGKKWLSDVYVMDTMSLEWTELAVTGSAPPPRCGHSATMIEKRLLIFGGRGGTGPIMGDLWALKGITEEDNETPGWTQLKLPGQSPSARCGHSVTSGGPYLLLFGGHGTGGWLSRYDVYYNECVILDRVSVQWKRLPTSNEPPPPRAYHSMTCTGPQFLLFGGFDGKNTFGDLWWLVPEDDPIAKRDLVPNVNSDSNHSTVTGDAQQSALKESQSGESPMLDLAKRLARDNVAEKASSPTTAVERDSPVPVVKATSPARQEEPGLKKDPPVGAEEAVVTGAQHVPPPTSSTILVKSTPDVKGVSCPIPGARGSMPFPDLYADMVSRIDQQHDILIRMKKEYEDMIMKAGETEALMKDQLAAEAGKRKKAEDDITQLQEAYRKLSEELEAVKADSAQKDKAMENVLGELKTARDSRLMLKDSINKCARAVLGADDPVLKEPSVKKLQALMDYD